MSTILPERNVIFVQEKTTKNASVIIVPDEQLPKYYEVTAVGPDCKIKVGTRVIPEFKTGMKTKIDGQEYLVFTEDHIFAVIKPTAAQP